MYFLLYLIDCAGLTGLVNPNYMLLTIFYKGAGTLNLHKKVTPTNI
ncbi:MAG: hypothetical protein RHS_4139 [Robinsoniella sp. RHS]|nr:MAG: hypothetical protein RHS_4139 [Robinsoniella sp. RHS]